MKDAQKDLVDPAVLGTRSVLQAVAKNKKTVKRVILTSSFAGKCCIVHPAPCLACVLFNLNACERPRQEPLSAWPGMKLTVHVLLRSCGEAQGRSQQRQAVHRGGLEQ